ncbi:MAG: ferric reductase-like transmembrane domain-containing protein [Myxococcota bacterium]
MQLGAILARNKRKAAAVTAWAAVTIAVVAVRAWGYRDAPTWLVPVARGSAAGIYLNSALVLLPMLRLTLSRSWTQPLRRVLALHAAIEAHAWAGVAILAFSAVHVAAYLGLWWAETDLFRAVARPVPLWTGIALVPLFAALGWGARVRTGGPFEGFYFTHFLSIPIGALCLVHAPWFPAIVGVPLGAFLVDRLLRLLWMTREARIASLAVEGRDLAVVLDRPPGFAYRSGDYAFLCIPAISRVQWHPFSLTNAPSDTAGLAFRIRLAGEWTRALAALAPGTPVHVDGPFATPCRDLHGCPRAVVVAGGIGITPFVSFLSEVRVDVRAGRPPPFDRLHLWWLERDVDSFRAFYPLLDELERALGGALTVSLVTRAGGDAPLPRLATTRPVAWDTALIELRSDGLDGATVFFCGPPGLSAVLRAASRGVGFKFRTESF